MIKRRSGKTNRYSVIGVNGHYLKRGDALFEKNIGTVICVKKLDCISI